MACLERWIGVVREPPVLSRNEATSPNAEELSDLQPVESVRKLLPAVPERVRPVVEPVEFSVRPALSPAFETAQRLVQWVLAAFSVESAVSQAVPARRVLQEKAVQG